MTLCLKQLKKHTKNIARKQRIIFLNRKIKKLIKTRRQMKVRCDRSCEPKREEQNSLSAFLIVLAYLQPSVLQNTFTAEPVIAIALIQPRTQDIIMFSVSGEISSPACSACCDRSAFSPAATPSAKPVPKNKAVRERSEP